MYRIIVGEMERPERKLAAEKCRISALSSADFCLRDRVDVAWGRIRWKGNRQEIRRLFEAERLDSGVLEHLDCGKDYAVVFLSCA